MGRLASTLNSFLGRIILGGLIGLVVGAILLFGLSANEGADEIVMAGLDELFRPRVILYKTSILLSVFFLSGAVLGCLSKNHARWISWCLVLAVLLASGLFFAAFKNLATRAFFAQQSSSALQNAQFSLLLLQTTENNDVKKLAQLKKSARQSLVEYTKTVEEWKIEGHRLDPVTLEVYQSVKAYLTPFTFAQKREADFFWKTMLPLALEFIKKNGLAITDLTTNNIERYRLHFFDDGRAGGVGDLYLKDGYNFSFSSNGTNAEVWSFSDGKTKTYCALESQPKEKVAAIKSLNLQNKLTLDSALQLSKKYFELENHRETNFNAPKIQQCYWSGDRGGKLPYYEITWYRKDVSPQDRESGNSTLPVVVIEVSGLDNHLISYTKAFLPVGGDF